MTGSMLELPERVYELQKHGHDVFLHCDFIQGLNTNTEEALLYIQDVIGAQGIISTKGSTIRNANKIGLKTIQRIFIVDTLSLTKSIENCKTTKPNAVEIMPGIMPSIIKQLVEEIEFPIIAGGLIQTREMRKLQFVQEQVQFQQVIMKYGYKKKKECNLVIELKNVSKVYKNAEETAVKGVSVHIKKGEFLF